MRRDRVRASLIFPAGATPEGRRAELVRAARATALGAVLGTLLSLAARSGTSQGRASRGKRPGGGGERSS
jgi:hypothetical protein